MRRSYAEFADRARGFAYHVRKHGYKRVGILATNTPAFLEAIFGISAAGAVNIGKAFEVLVVGNIETDLEHQAVNYRLKKDDISYIFQHSDADAIVVDAEFIGLLDSYRKARPNVPLIIDTDTDATDGDASGPFDQAVLEGWEYDKAHGNRGWTGLETKAADEEDVIALAYTSGTTARPKGVEFTHRGCYLAAMGNVIESGLNQAEGCRYLWTLPMFHAMGKWYLIETWKFCS